MALFIKNIYDFKNSLNWHGFARDILCPFGGDVEEQIHDHLNDIFLDLAMIEQNDEHQVNIYLESIKPNLEFLRNKKLGFLFVLKKQKTQAGIFNIGHYLLTSEDGYMCEGDGCDGQPVHSVSKLCAKGETLLVQSTSTNSPLGFWICKEAVNISLEKTANFCLDCELS